MSVPTATGGTPESAWYGWESLHTMRELSLAGCAAALVVAPHPDDEVLGVGGTLAELDERGADVSLLALTDGEASHPRAPVRRDEVAARRVAETDAALGDLVRTCPITRLGLPDGELSEHEQSIREAVELHLTRGMWCFAPYREDGHPDHEAAARATALACRSRGARLLEYPIWMWHWTTPESPVVAPWTRARRIPLALTTRWRKARAIERFESQIAPISSGVGGEAILPPAVLEHFLRPFEVVFA